MNTRDFLDAVRVKYALTSDYQLCKLLGWRSSRASMYRTTARELDDEGCLQIAALLEVPPAYVMASIAAARAKSAKARREWMRAARLLKAGTAAALVVASLGSVQMPREALQASLESANEQVIHYAQCVLGALKRALRALCRLRHRRPPRGALDYCVLQRSTLDRDRFPRLSN